MRRPLRLREAICATVLWSTSTGLSLAQDSRVRLASETSSAPAVQVPQRIWPYQRSAGAFELHSTVPIEFFDRLLPGLTSLPNELQETLQIDLSNPKIDVVVLENREALDAYARRLIPAAPSRRALYVRHRGPGLVLTHFNSAWLSDARHECTHALLDGSKLKLPLWLDEGLAEYFETVNANRLAHTSHLAAVKSQLRYGQVPDLERLELMDANATMTGKDYRDAWSVTAFLLNSSKSNADTFIGYLQDLQRNQAAGFLSHRLKPGIKSWREEFSNFYR